MLLEQGNSLLLCSCVRYTEICDSKHPFSTEFSKEQTLLGLLCLPAPAGAAGAALLSFSLVAPDQSRDILF